MDKPTNNAKSFEKFCRMCRQELSDSAPKYVCLKGHHQCESCNKQWVNKCGICNSFTKRTNESVVDLAKGNVFPHRRDSVSEYFKVLKLQSETPNVQNRGFKRTVSTSCILPGPSLANQNIRKPIAPNRGRLSSTSSLSEGDNASLAKLFPPLPDKQVTDEPAKAMHREAPFLYNDFNDIPILVGLPSTESSSLSNHNDGSRATTPRHRLYRSPTDTAIKKGASDADKHYENFKKLSHQAKTQQKMPPKAGIASFLTRSVRSSQPTAKESKVSRSSRDSKSSKASVPSTLEPSTSVTGNGACGVESSQTKVATETVVSNSLEPLMTTGVPRAHVVGATSEQLVSSTSQPRSSRPMFRATEPNLVLNRAHSSQPLGRAHKHTQLFNPHPEPSTSTKHSSNHTSNRPTEKPKETSDSEQSHQLLASFKIEEHGIRTATVTAATTVFQDNSMSPSTDNASKNNFLNSMITNITKEAIQDMINEQMSQRNQMINQHQMVQHQQSFFDCPLLQQQQQDQSVDSQKSCPRSRSFSQDRQEFDQMFTLLQQQQQQEQQLQLQLQQQQQHEQQQQEKQKQMDQVMEQQKIMNTVQVTPTPTPPHLALPNQPYNVSATTTSTNINGLGGNNVPDCFNELLGNQWERYTLYQRVPQGVNLKWPVDVELLQRFEQAKQQNLVAIAKIDNDATRMHSTESAFSSPNHQMGGFGMYRDLNLPTTSENNMHADKGHYCTATTTTTTSTSMQSMEEAPSATKTVTASSSAHTATTSTTLTAQNQSIYPTNVKRDASFIVMHATEFLPSQDQSSAFANDISQKSKADDQQYDARMEKVLGTLKESMPMPTAVKPHVLSETVTFDDTEPATDTAVCEETDQEDILLENIPSVCVSDAETDKYGRALLAIRAHYRPPSFIQMSTVKLFEQPVCMPPAQQFQFVAEFEEDAESAEFYKKLQEEMQKEPVDAHQVIMDRAPLRCPDTKCDQSIFVSDFCQHLLCDHFSVPLERIEPSCCKTFFCDARFLRKGTSRCLMCFFIRGKIKNISNSEFKDYLPIMVMTSRVDMRELCGFPPRETRKSHEHMLFWVTGLVPEKLPISCSLAIWQTAGQVPGGHYCMSNDVYPLRCSQNPRDVWHSGCAMILHPKEIYRLSRACTEMINLQLVIH